MTTMTLSEARDHLAELLARAARGEDVAIAGEDGRVFRVVLSESTTTKKRGLVGSARGKIWMADDFDEVPGDVEASIQ
jgi:antitoxin (DNA-binding transcriptional repressor) of toxin-antitoxin stability system